MTAPTEPPPAVRAIHLSQDAVVTFRLLYEHSIEAAALADAADPRLRRMDGQAFEAELSSTLFLDHQGMSTSILSIRDVSALQRVQRSLHESEMRLGFALDAARIGDWDMDLRTNVARRSLRHDPCFGYREPVATWGDGSVHWLWSKGRFYFDDDGRPQRVAGIQVDVTARRALDDALRRSVERLQLVLRTSSEGPWDIDLTTGMPYCSPGWLEMLGLDVALRPPDAEFWLALCHPEDIARVRQAFAAALEGSSDTYEIELRMRHADGHCVPVQSRGIVVRDDQGRAQRVTGSNRDLTQRNRLRETAHRRVVAEASSQAKSDFLTQMSHELRTPLNAVIGFSQLLKVHGTEALSAAQERHIGHIEQAGWHLLARRPCGPALLARRRWPGRAHGKRQRARARRSAASATVSALQSARTRGRPGAGHGHRPGDLQAPGRIDERHADGVQRRRQGQRVRAAPARGREHGGPWPAIGAHKPTGADPAGQATARRRWPGRACRAQERPGHGHHPRRRRRRLGRCVHRIDGRRAGGRRPDLPGQADRDAPAVCRDRRLAGRRRAAAAASRLRRGCRGAHRRLVEPVVTDTA